MEEGIEEGGEKDEGFLRAVCFTFSTKRPYAPTEFLTFFFPSLRRQAHPVLLRYVSHACATHLCQNRVKDFVSFPLSFLNLPLIDRCLFLSDSFVFRAGR